MTKEDIINVLRTYDNVFGLNDGGSSHQAFFWFNMDLANDITGEARNLIHKIIENGSNQKI